MEYEISRRAHADAILAMLNDQTVKNHIQEHTIQPPNSAQKKNTKISTLSLQQSVCGKQA